MWNETAYTNLHLVCGLLSENTALFACNLSIFEHVEVCGSWCATAVWITSNLTAYVILNYHPCMKGVKVKKKVKHLVSRLKSRCTCKFFFTIFLWLFSSFVDSARKNLKFCNFSIWNRNNKTVTAGYVWINFPYLKLHILQCDYYTCAHGSVNAEMPYCPSLYRCKHSVIMCCLFVWQCTVRFIWCSLHLKKKIKTQIRKE